MFDIEILFAFGYYLKANAAKEATMNRIANPSFDTDRPPSAAGLSPLTRLDLHDEAQRRLHDLIWRMHRGRWPLLRCLAMRQMDGVIYEAVEWLRRTSPHFAVVSWRPDGLGLSWHDAPSARAARLELYTMRPGPTDSPASPVRSIGRLGTPVGKG